MTANQIEYWKLKENIRHNLVSESIEKPYKESATLLNYEQIKTQPTIRALNLAQQEAANASAAAGYASAAASYATAQRQYEAIETERSSQAVNYSHANLFDEQANLVHTQEYQLSLGNIGAEFTHYRTQDQYNMYMGNNTLRDETARAQNFAYYIGGVIPIFNGVSSAANSVGTIVNLFGG